MSGPFGSQQWMYNASSGFYPYELNNSLKFEDGDSSYLSRTPASAGNRTTWTLSMWVKRANISTSQMLFSAGTSSIHYANIQSDNTIRWRNSTLDYETTQVFRDPSAWYHLVFKWDTTNSTAADRAEIYVNNEKITVYDVKTNASSSENSIWNNNVKHTLGNYAYNNTLYFDGYMTEVNFIDGTALDPTSFGETKEGIWIPKDPTGLTYGTNGFRLPFTETTSANGFNTVTYSGNGATQSIEGVGFSPDFVWIKERTSTSVATFNDTIRGATNYLVPSSTQAEASISDLVTSFDADGFTSGSNGASNQSGQDYVAWCWGGGTNDKTYTVTVVDDGGNKYRFDGHGTSSITLELTEGATYTFNYPSAHPLRFSTTSDGTHGGGSEYTTGVTHVSGTQTTFTVPSGAPTLYYYCSQHSGMGGQVNTNTTDGPTYAEGTILSRAKPNADYGFSIVTWTGNGTDGATVGHGLSQTPEMIIIKKRANNSGGNTGYWVTQHVGLATDPEATSSTFTLSGYTNGAVYLNATNAQSSYGFDNQVNGNTDTFVAYCFHSVDGYQKLGSYTGNGSTTGPTVTLGFRPAFLLIKRTDSTGEWILMDNTRHPSNPNDLALFARLNYAEASSSSYEVDFNSDGFQLKNTNSSFNASSGTYIYLAIADTRDALFTSDASGNDNNWTPNALQHSDVMPDTPTDGFAVLNNVGNTTNMTFSEGNLKTTVSGTSAAKCEATFAVSSGKWYWEVYIKSFTSFSAAMIGIKDITVSGHETHNFTHSSIYAYYANTGNKYNSGNQGSYGATFTTGDIIGVALDLDAGTLTFYKNGVSQGTAFSSLTGTYTLHLGTGLYAWVGLANFGQDSSFNANEIAQGNADDNGKGDFYYAPPSGYLALCNANLPDPAIDPNAGENPEDHFNTVLWTGDGSDRNIDVGFKSDFVWVKERNNTVHHRIYDSVRGDGKTIFSSLGNAEYDAAGDGIHFDYTNGFNIDYGANGGSYNGSSDTYVGWNWKAGGTAVANTDGDINTNVSVNDDAGFSIISYTGNGSASQQTIGHGLSTKPDLAIVKDLTQGYNWMVLFDIIDGSYDFIQGLNTASAKSNGSGTFATTSTVTLLASSGNLNGSGDNYICYCFSSKEGYSKFGSYTGTGSTDGPFLYTGFRPAFVIIKNASATEAWQLIDSERSPHNVANAVLYPNSSAAESNPLTAANTDFLSNGFKIRAAGGNTNDSGLTYIYMAFAEQPFKYSNAR